MPAITVDHLLGRALDFEQRLEALYAGLRDRATRDGTRLLVYYLARHRHHLPDALESFTPEELVHIRSVPLRYDNTGFDPEKVFAGVELASDIDGTELLDAAISLVSHLIGLYSWVTQRSLGPEATRLFEALLRIEQDHVIELKKTKATHYF